MKTFNQSLFLTRVVDGLLTIVEIFLVLRILLKLFGANTGASFVAWVYAISQPLLSPFQYIFPSPVFQGQYILEFSALFALVIYAIAAWLVNEFIYFVADAVEPARTRRWDAYRQTKDKK